MFIRRHGMENVLRKLVLSPTKGSSNIHTIAGTVRSLERSSNGSRVSAVVIRKPDGAELTINDPALVIGKSTLPLFDFVLKTCADCSGDTQAGLKWLRRAGYDIPQSARLEYDQKLHYVPVTFTLTDDMKRRIHKILIDGGQEGLDRIGWLYTFVPHYNICSEGFVLGKMDNDTSRCC